MTAATSASAATTARFEEIWAAEDKVGHAKASVAFAPATLPLYLLEGRRVGLKRAQGELSALVDALSLEEMAAYGTFRAEKFAEIKELVAEHDARAAARQGR